MQGHDPLPIGCCDFFTFECGGGASTQFVESGPEYIQYLILSGTGNQQIKMTQLLTQLTGITYQSHFLNHRIKRIEIISGTHFCRLRDKCWLERV